jgi:hypothetical protein
MLYNKAIVSLISKGFTKDNKIKHIVPIVSLQIIYVKTFHLKETMLTYLPNDQLQTLIDPTAMNRHKKPS